MIAWLRIRETYLIMRIRKWLYVPTVTDMTSYVNNALCQEACRRRLDIQATHELLLEMMAQIRILQETVKMMALRHAKYDMEEIERGTREINASGK